MCLNRYTLCVAGSDERIKRYSHTDALCVTGSDVWFKRYAHTDALCVAGVLGMACPSLPWSSHTTALIAAGASCGAVTAIASIVACCCLLYPIARRKMSRDEEEEKLPEEEDAATGSVGLGGLTGPAAVPESAPVAISVTKI